MHAIHRRSGELRSSQPPPILSPFGANHRWVLQQRVAVHARDDVIADRPPHAHQGQHPPQRPRVRLGQAGAVPLVQPAVCSPAFMGQPQFRDEPIEPDEERGVQLAL